MSCPARESSFRLEIAGLPESFVVVAFTGKESISEPFLFEVELVTSDTPLDLAGLLYRSVWLSFGSCGRGIHGQLHEVVQHRHGGNCHVRIEPKLAYLAQRFSQRVFSGRSVPQIIRQVLSGHGIGGRGLCLDLSGDFPTRDVCSQYRESDLQFLQRICAQAGIRFHFEHARDGHCLVFSDAPGSVFSADEVIYGGDGQADAVHAFSAQVGFEGIGIQAAEGQSDLMHLHSGQTLTLTAHPFKDWNRRWLLTRVEHRGQSGRYANRFRAIPFALSFVADKVPAKPVMVSRQRGWVVNVDEPADQVPGRVAVQFDWVYQGEGASASHCWLPLAPELAACAGDRIREGTEVLVSFIEGDPDRPLICAFLGPPPLIGTQPAPASASLSETPGTPGIDDHLLSAVRGGEPLFLLCLLPGGGAFNPCARAVCICRLVTQRGAGAAP
ncbi:type VI secretion protein [Pseudomonas sp. Z4-7]|uniref:type VI secretion system Vgr family protein n=1 Tax=Pseudomonas sp. Z4-7 TaxID=2817413 RepID=UPI003DA82BCC